MAVEKSPAYCISLQRAVDRRRLMETLWRQQLVFDFSFWDAFDRRRIATLEWYSPFVKRNMSSGELACIFSYLELFWYLEQQQVDGAFVLEDDITPLVRCKHLIFDAVQATLHERPSVQKILLHELSPANDSLREHIYTEPSAVSSLCAVAPYGNQFFYVTREGIAAELFLLQTLLFPADHSQEFYFAPKKLLAITNQPLAKHAWFGAEAATYIGNKFRNTKRRFIC